MATLHNTIEATKSAGKWLGIILGGVICIIMLIRVGIAIKEKFAPTPAPPPKVEFGKIPKVPFPENTITNPFTFVINTPSGKLPSEIPDRTFIYEIQQPAANLLSLTEIKDLVKSTEFQDATPLAQNETDYLWSLAKSPFKRLTFNILTRDFFLISQYQADQAVLDARKLSDEQGSVKTAQAFFQSLNSYPVDIDETRTTATKYAISNGILTPASSLSTTQVIMVNFYQSVDSKLAMVYPHPPNSTINALIGSGENNPQILEAHFSGRQITQNKGEYPIKTPEQAFKELESGQGYIAAYQGASASSTSFGTSSTEIGINDVSLGYFLADRKQKYLMPVYVFTGNNGFIAYISAVSDEWTDSAIPQ